MKYVTSWHFLNDRETTNDLQKFFNFPLTIAPTIFNCLLQILKNEILELMSVKMIEKT